MNFLENGIGRVSPVIANLVVYEKACPDVSTRLPTIKNTFHKFSMNVIFKEVGENWQSDTHGLLKRVLFLVSLDTFIFDIRKDIDKLRGTHQSSTGNSISILVVTVLNEDVEEDDDDININFEDEEVLECFKLIKIDSFDKLHEWWPNVLHFFKGQTIATAPDTSQQQYVCFFVIDDESTEAVEWYKCHKDTLEKFGRIRCQRNRDSAHSDERYMKYSNYVAVYVRTDSFNSSELNDTIKKATNNGCGLRVYLENADSEFAKEVLDECRLTLSGVSSYEHWAYLLKDLNIGKLDLAWVLTLYVPMSFPFGLGWSIIFIEWSQVIIFK